MVYPGDYIGPSLPDLSGVDVDSPFLTDVINEYKSIPVRGQFIRFDPKNIFNNTDAYKKFSIQKLIDKLHKTHFQGAARTQCGRYIYLSGGDVKLQWSQIFVLSINSYRNQLSTPMPKRAEQGPIGSNVIHKKKPPA